MAGRKRPFDEDNEDDVKRLRELSGEHADESAGPSQAAGAAFPSVSSQSLSDREKAERFATVFGPRCHALSEHFKSKCPPNEYSVENSPSENFVIGQTRFVIYNCNNMFVTKYFGVDYFRDHLDNLTAFLCLLFKRKDFHAASLLLKILLKIMKALKDVVIEIQTSFKEASTDWQAVIVMYEELQTLIDGNLPAITLPTLPSHLTIELTAVIGEGVNKEAFEAKIGDKKVIVKQQQSDDQYHLAACISLLRSPFITKIEALFPLGDWTRRMTIMEHNESISCYHLTNFMEGLDLDILQAVTAQMCLGVEYLHRMGVFHRDIKPRNLIVDKDCRVKIIDLDSLVMAPGKYTPRRNFRYYEKHCANTTMAGRAGTKYFLAPEAIEALNGAEKKYGRALDWWTVGGTVYFLATKRHYSEIERPTVPAILQAVSNLKFTVNASKYPDRPAATPATQQFIKDFLVAEPEKRLGVNSWEKLVSHAFFDGFDWNAWKDGKGSAEFPVVEDCVTRILIGFRRMRVKRTFQEKFGEITESSMLNIKEVRSKIIVNTYEENVVENMTDIDSMPEIIFANPPALKSRLTNAYQGAATRDDWTDTQ